MKFFWENGFFFFFFEKLEVLEKFSFLDYFGKLDFEANWISWKNAIFFIILDFLKK